MSKQLCPSSSTLRIGFIPEGGHSTGKNKRRLADSLGCRILVGFQKRLIWTIVRGYLTMIHMNN